MADQAHAEKSFEWVVFELFEELVKIFEYEDATKSERLIVDVLESNPTHSTEGRRISEVLREKAEVPEGEALAIRSHHFEVIIEPESIMAQQLRKITEPDKGYPPLLQQAASLARTAGRVTMGAVKKGRILAPEDVVMERWDICHGCDSWDSSEKRCKECGCYSKAKNTLAESRCPLGKWEPYQEE